MAFTSGSTTSVMRAILAARSFSETRLHHAETAPAPFGASPAKHHNVGIAASTPVGGGLQAVSGQRARGGADRPRRKPRPVAAQIKPQFIKPRLRMQPQLPPALRRPLGSRARNLAWYGAKSASASALVAGLRITGKAWLR
jgi:hypothetical protein